MNWVEEALEVLRGKSSIFTKVLAHFPLVRNDRVGTAGVNKTHVAYSLPFMESLGGPEQRAFVLAHECMHILEDHFCRVGPRDRMRWNVAADFSVNNQLVEDYEMTPIDGALWGSYQGMLTEEIYAHLPASLEMKELDNHQGWGQAPSKEQMEALARSLTPAEKEELGKILNRYGTRSLDNVLQAELQRIASFDLLQKLVLQKSVRDVTWRQPSRRLAHRGIYLPSKQREKVRLVICVDTSGSTQGPLVLRFMALVRSLLRSGEVEATIIQADAVVRCIQKMYEFDGKIHGGGGTDFGPALAEARKMGAALVLYLTDLDGSYPSAQPNVVWVGPRQSTTTPPFGKVVRMW